MCRLGVIFARTQVPVSVDRIRHIPPPWSGTGGGILARQRDLRRPPYKPAVVTGRWCRCAAFSCVRRRPGDGSTLSYLFQKRLF